jgi:hypothetical protein
VEDDAEAEPLRSATMTQKRQVHLPEDLCATAEKRFGERFENLDSLLEFILRELVRDEAQVMDEAEKAMIDKRLRDLGYL